MSDSDDEPGTTEDIATDFEPDASFKSLGVCDTLCKACDALRWKRPTKIQQQAIPVALQGHDIIGLAETGSGKTAAFAIPILQDLLEKQKKIFALILTPTRELAFQISEQFSALGVYMGATTSVIVGGVDMMTQSIALAKRPHIIVATPGRLADHLKTTKGFSLKSLQYLVMDEADRILNMDYGQAVDLILRNSPSDRKTYLFSATMTQKVEKLQRASLKNPVKIEVANKYQTVDTLLQYYLFIPAIHKDAYLIYLLTENSGSSIIVFTSTCKNTMRLAVMLRYLNFTAIPLNGQLNQTKRIYCLNEFKSKSRSILIATDVASRGLDIPHVDVIINFDVPTRSKDYIHRVGRTARAGRHGKAITLVTQYDVELYQRIEFLLQKKLPLYPVVKEEVEVFYDTVAEAQQLTNTKLKSMEGRKGKKRQLKMDDLDDTEESLGVRRTLNKKRKRR